MVAQNQGEVTLWGQGTWSQVGIGTWSQVGIVIWNQGRDLNLLQRHRGEKGVPEAGRHGEGCQIPTADRPGSGRWHGKASTEDPQGQKKGCSSALGSLGKQWGARSMTFTQGGGTGPGPAQPEDQAPSCAAQDWRYLSSWPASSRSWAVLHRGAAQSQAQPQRGPTDDQHRQGDDGDRFQLQP